MTSPFTNIPLKDISVTQLNGLRNLINACESSIFSQNCLPWFNYLSPILERTSTSLKIKDAACLCLKDLLRFASSNAFISRELSTRHLSAFIENLTISVDLLNSNRSAFDLLNTLVHLYPGISGQFGGKIEKRALACVETNSQAEVLQAAAKCIARLPFSGKQAKREERCQEFQDKLIGSITEIGRDVTKLLGASSELDDFNSVKRFGFPKIKIQSENIMLFSRRFHFLLRTFESFLSQTTPCSISLNVTHFLKVFVGFLSINCIKLKKSSTPEIHQSAKIALNIQYHMWGCLSLLFDVLRSAMALHATVMINLSCQHLDWTKAGTESNQLDPTLTKHRVSVYQFLITFLRHVGLLALIPIYSNRTKLVGHLLEDVKSFSRPRAHSTQQLNRPSDPVVGGPVNRKVKRKKNLKQNKISVVMSDDVFSQDVKVNVEACSTLTLVAWQVLTVFWGQLANFVDHDPLSRTENGIFHVNCSILTKIQWTVERLLSDIISKPRVDIIPYQSSGVLLALVEFLEVFYLPRQQSSCPVLISLISTFLKILFNHPESSVQVSASRALVRLDACVSCWTAPLSKLSVTSISNQDSSKLEQLDSIDDEISDMDEVVDLEPIITPAVEILVSSSLSIPVTEEDTVPIVSTSSAIVVDSPDSSSTTKTQDRNTNDDFFADISTPKRIRLSSSCCSKESVSTSIVKSDVENGTMLSSVKPAKIEPRHTNNKCNNSNVESNHQKDSDNVSLEDMLASFVDTT